MCLLEAYGLNRGSVSHFAASASTHALKPKPFSSAENRGEIHHPQLFLVRRQSLSLSFYTWAFHTVPELLRLLKLMQSLRLLLLCFFCAVEPGVIVSTPLKHGVNLRWCLLLIGGLRILTMAWQRFCEAVNSWTSQITPPASVFCFFFSPKLVCTHYAHVLLSLLAVSLSQWNVIFYHGFYLLGLLNAILRALWLCISYINFIICFWIFSFSAFSYRCQ